MDREEISNAYPSGHSSGSVGWSSTNSLLRHQYPGGQASALRFDRHLKPVGHAAESNSRFFLHQYPGGQDDEECSSCSSAVSSAGTVGDNSPYIPIRRAINVSWCNIPVKSKRWLKFIFHSSVQLKRRILLEPRWVSLICKCNISKWGLTSEVHVFHRSSVFGQSEI